MWWVQHIIIQYNLSFIVCSNRKKKVLIDRKMVETRFKCHGYEVTALRFQYNWTHTHTHTYTYPEPSIHLRISRVKYCAFSLTICALAGGTTSRECRRINLSHLIRRYMEGTNFVTGEHRAHTHIENKTKQRTTKAITTTTTATAEEEKTTKLKQNQKQINIFDTVPIMFNDLHVVLSETQMQTYNHILAH